MIKLHAPAPTPGLAEPDPVLLKVEVQLRMAGLAYERLVGGPDTPPGHRLPFIEDDGEIVAGSTLIRDHVERTYGIDLDKGLSVRERANAWSIERMLEDHLGRLMAYAPRSPDINANTKGVRGPLAANMPTHDAAPQDGAERLEQAGRSLSALSVLLGDHPFMMGFYPTGVDAITFAMLACLSARPSDTPLHQMVEAHGAFGPYVRRMAARFCSDSVWWWGERSIAA
ncbi:glutathione S-transferase family protein [Niveispirillum fermenti]|uniref:glutathione S-transferase family protein n=1 Tax=Niveispirillum fermenti TaxID=1233113 RepID=UPI003A8770AD